MPRSARSSSTSRYDNAKRRYQRTESTITSGGKQKPAKADRGTVAGRGRRVLIAPVCLVTAGATAPSGLPGRPAADGRAGRAHAPCGAPVVLESWDVVGQADPPARQTPVL